MLKNLTSTAPASVLGAHQVSSFATPVLELRIPLHAAFTENKMPVQPDEHYSDERDSMRPSDFVQQKLEASKLRFVSVSIMLDRRTVLRPKT